MASLRHIDHRDKICQHLDLTVFERCFSADVVREILAAQPCRSREDGTLIRPRIRHCTPLSLVLFQLCCSWWRSLSQKQVWSHITDGLADLHPWAHAETMSAAALSVQRRHLGPEPFRQMIQQCCRCRCDPVKTPSAFFQGWRVMAVDGSLFNVADTRDNEQVFGRARNQYGQGAYPQVRAVMLMECASHVVTAVALGGYQCSEAHGVQQVLASVQSGMLVLADSGIFSGSVAERITQAGAHLLCALPSTTLKHLAEPLSDGSFLAELKPCRSAVYRATKPQQLRVIEYRLTDARLGKPGRVYRLVTSLLDEQQYPAHELIALYRQRWEAEVIIRELKSVLHERMKVLRSRTADGVKQELYGLILAHYALRTWMLDAAEAVDQDPRTVSATNALQHVRRRVERLSTHDPGDREAILARLVHLISREVLSTPHLRCNRRELKQIYQKYKPKQKGAPAPLPFESTQTYLQFVALVVRTLLAENNETPSFKTDSNAPPRSP